MVQRLVTAVFKKLSPFYAKFATRSERDGFVLFLRLENMPLLSDRLGQAEITYLLLQLTLRLSNATRSNDSVQIISPGVFVILLQSKSAADAMGISVRLQQCGQKPIAIAGQTLTPVLTGIILRNKAAETAQFTQLINHGHHKLTQLQSDLLGQISMVEMQFDPASPALPLSVAQAAQMGQIIAYFQPKLSCHTGKVTGFEVLARWNHPVRGLLPPTDFTPSMTPADHNALTFAMLGQALQALSAWHASTYQVPTVSINISINELNNPQFADQILHELGLHNLHPEMLIIEVLESIGHMHTNESAHINLKRLRDAGCLFDLDDFGTGHASLDAVRNFGMRRIKIDRSFVTGCHDCPEQQRMILGIFALAEQLGITTIAEGVETPEEHSYLAQIGCSEVQGFAIGYPMPFNETFAFLKQQKLREENLPNLPLRKK